MTREPIAEEPEPNSVFEGDLTPAQKRELVAELRRHIDRDHDCVIMYTLPQADNVTREILGSERGSTSEINQALTSGFALPGFPGRIAEMDARKVLGRRDFTFGSTHYP